MPPIVAARTTAVIAAAAAGATVPATRAPRPSGRAAGTSRRHAQVAASLPVTAATITAAGPRPAASAWVSAATWISSVRTRVTTPNGPISERRMISSA
jgi:hypothetical protein